MPTYILIISNVFQAKTGFEPGILGCVAVIIFLKEKIRRPFKKGWLLNVKVDVVISAVLAK
jgi:hypothetical protein